MVLGLFGWSVIKISKVLQIRNSKKSPLGLHEMFRTMIILLGACVEGINVALIETSIHLYIVCQPGSCGNEAI